MEDLLARVVVFTILSLVALGVGSLIRKLSGQRDVRALPDSDHRTELLRGIRRMRAQGSSLQECMEYLKKQGLRTGVARGLVIDLDREVPADVTNPLEGTWRGYRFLYPRNWRVKELGREGWPDGGISIEGLGSSMVLLFRVTSPDAYERILASQEKQVGVGERRTINSWGSFRGNGIVLRGPHAKLRLLVEVVVFRPEVRDEAFGVTQYHALEEAELVAPGLQLIEKSLMPAGNLTRQ